MREREKKKYVHLRMLYGLKLWHFLISLNSCYKRRIIDFDTQYNKYFVLNYNSPEQYLKLSLRHVWIKKKLFLRKRISCRNFFSNKLWQNWRHVSWKSHCGLGYLKFPPFFFPFYSETNWSRKKTYFTDPFQVEVEKQVLCTLVVFLNTWLIFNIDI